VKRILIISPYFPPANTPDMQRVRMSLPHYRAFGWDPVVLAVDIRFQGAVIEPELLETVPADVRVVKCGALPPRWAKWFLLGTLGLRCWPFLFWRGTRMLRRERFDLILFSNTQFITFTLGPIWKRWFGVPYALDFQDPWRTNYYELPGSRKPPGGWKYQFARLQAFLFEGWCVRGACAAMSVSPMYLEDLRARYPGFKTTPTDVIQFGVSPGDMKHAAALPEPAHRFSRDHGEIHLVYTGASGPVMPHALTVLFVALRQYRELHPESASRFRLHFVGTSYAAPGKAKASVEPIAESCGVGDMVIEVPNRIGYLESLRLQLNADVLLLLGSSDAAYSPSKMYTYFLTGRPMLAVVFRDSVMEMLLDNLNCSFMARFRNDTPKHEAYAEIHRCFDLILNGLQPGTLPERSEAYFKAHFTSNELTRRQCTLFDTGIAGVGKSTPS